RRVNANTQYYYTDYNTSLPLDDSEVLNNGLQLLRDWSEDLIFDQNSLDVERGAVLGEMRRNNPYNQWISDKITDFIIEKTIYERQEREKVKQNIKMFNPEAFKRFHEDWYQPHQQAAIIVGDLNPEKVEEKIKKLFSDLESSKNRRISKNRIKNQKVMLNNENRFASVLDTVTPNLKLAILFEQPDLNDQYETKNDLYLLLLQELYLNLAKNKKDNLENQLNVPYSNLSLNYKLNQIGDGQISTARMIIDFENDSQEDIIDTIKKSLQVWKQIHSSYSSTDFQHAKQQVIEKYNRSGMVKASVLLEQYKNHFVNGIAAPHPELASQFKIEILNDINFEDFQNYIEKYKSLNENTDFLFFKNREHIPPNFNKLKSLVKQVDTAIVPPIPPAPSPIESLSKDIREPVIKKINTDMGKEDILGVYRVTLNNGIRLILKPTSPNSPSFQNTIDIKAVQDNNIEPDNREKYLSAMAFIELLNHSGAASYSRFQLEQFMKSKNIKLHFNATREIQTIHGRGDTNNLEELLNLIVLLSTESKINSQNLTNWKNSKHQEISGYGLRGSPLFVEAKIKEKWYPEVPQFKVEDLNQITEDSLIKASQEWFSNFGDFTFIVTGDFKKDEVLPIFNQKFSTLPTRKLKRNIPKAKFKFPVKKMNETIYLNNINQAYVHLYFPVTVKDNIENRIILRILSKALHQRIFKHLREGCYFPSGGGLWVDNERNIYAFRIRFNSELGNQRKMINVAMREFKKLKEEGIDKTSLENIISDEVKSFEKYFDNFGFSNFWSDYLQSNQENTEEYVSNILQYGTLMEHFISTEDINVAARKLFTEKNFQQFVFLPNEYN
ncbi:insulinase family protein, partial [uncultured Salegentibacter sp.]|uniref:M16 family metallopeptidase n=1 Tax=uncultured Salegentibacter sp. TaxID=259320 RepID=UPI0030DA29CF